MPGGLSGFTTFTPSEAATLYTRGLRDGVTVAVALSGGGDSVGLLSVLSGTACVRNGRVRLVALTVDHALRPGSANEASAMAEFCRGLAISHLTLNWRGDKPKPGLSEAARNARYRLLAEGAEQLHADCLVTAPHAGRPTRNRRNAAPAQRHGPAGPFRHCARCAVLRQARGSSALPKCPRSDIRAHLSGVASAGFDDPSNDDPRYERVRVRQSGEFGWGRTPSPLPAKGEWLPPWRQRRISGHMHACLMPLPCSSNSTGWTTVRPAALRLRR